MVQSVKAWEAVPAGHLRLGSRCLLRYHTDRPAYLPKILASKTAHFLAHGQLLAGLIRN